MVENEFNEAEELVNIIRNITLTAIKEYKEGRLSRDELKEMRDIVKRLIDIIDKRISELEREE